MCKTQRISRAHELANGERSELVCYKRAVYQVYTRNTHASNMNNSTAQKHGWVRKEFSILDCVWKDKHGNLCALDVVTETPPEEQPKEFTDKFYYRGVVIEFVRNKRDKAIVLGMDLWHDLDSLVKTSAYKKKKETEDDDDMKIMKEMLMQGAFKKDNSVEE